MKNVFKTKAVYAAMLAGLGAVGMAGSASAVQVNSDGTGQVLIYPYYTTRVASTPITSGAYNTYVSITNTTANYKALKVRFLESRNSREVLDFNLFLSPRDVWTASLEPNTSGGTTIFSADKSCTYGVIDPVAGQAFSNLAYSGGSSDNEDASLDRTREGYFEIIEMGEIPDNGAGTASRALRTAVLHVSGVAPCTNAVLAASDADALGVVTAAAYALVPTVTVFGDAHLTVPTGGLMGSASLVNPLTGVDYTMDAIALDGWTTVTVPFASTSTNPSLGGGNVSTSNVFYSDGTVRGAVWAADALPITATANAKAVSAVLMRNNVFNEYVLDTGTVSGTDWVVTFPTKKLFVALDTCGGGAACTAVNNVRDRTATAAFPFNENFGNGGSCDEVTLTQYDREETTSTSAGGFSPVAPGATNALCWEANVITFNSSNILASAHAKNTNVTYQNGWMNLGLNHGPYASGSDTILSAVSSTTNAVADALNDYRGLPVVGFMVQDFINSTLVTGTGATPGAAFGGNFVHKYSRLIN